MFCMHPNRRNVIQQLRRDVDFLAQQNMLDYSLLIGVFSATANRGPPNNPLRLPVSELDDWKGGPLFGKPCQLSARDRLDDERQNMYLFGIIDITERTRIKWILEGPTKHCLGWKGGLFYCLYHCCCCGCHGNPRFNPDGATSVDPETYALRFQEFMEKVVLQVDSQSYSDYYLTPNMELGDDGDALMAQHTRHSEVVEEKPSGDEEHVHEEKCASMECRESDRHFHEVKSNWHSTTFLN